MAYLIADNILSPLGSTSEQNYQAVKAGRSALHRYDGAFRLPEPFTASLFTEAQEAEWLLEGYTRFESLAIGSARKAIEQSGIDVSQPDVLLVLSTTKGNIELLGQEPLPEQEYPGQAALRIAQALGFTTQPIVVCNACISSLSALIAACRLIDSGYYRHVVVCGADCQGRFIISGFQSFKALSIEECRPFDIERLGLNLGEAAATMVLSSHPIGQGSAWRFSGGAVRNDAYHISAPSKQGEGAFRALKAVCEDKDLAELAFVSAHGTATMFNDQMESVAIERAGLASVPVNGLKGYYGHTMGAAGVLETIISTKAVDDHIIIGTRGYAELGVSGRIHPSAQHEPTYRRAFVKMLSGFGGCNAALWVENERDTGCEVRGTRCEVRGAEAEKGRDTGCEVRGTRCEVRGTRCEKATSEAPIRPAVELRTLHRVSLSPERVEVDGKAVAHESTGRGLLRELYKAHVGDYPKFYKMDPLSQLGFLAAELLLRAEGERPADVAESRAVVLFNSSSSVVADTDYLQSIASEEEYFPSPSLFVYTLPNIVTGEISIRNGYHGETSFYVFAQRNRDAEAAILRSMAQDSSLKSAICGWVDYENENRFTADISLVEIRRKTLSNSLVEPENLDHFLIEAQ